MLGDRVYQPGFLPAGNDLRAEGLSEADARAACAKEERCAGVTFQATGSERGEHAKHRMLFKTSAEGLSGGPDSGWHTWLKVSHRENSYYYVLP